MPNFTEIGQTAGKHLSTWTDGHFFFLFFFIETHFFTNGKPRISRSNLYMKSKKRKKEKVPKSIYSFSDRVGHLNFFIPEVKGQRWIKLEVAKASERLGAYSFSSFVYTE